MNRIIDLSLAVEPGMITYPSPSHTRFESSILGRIPIEGRETRKFSMGSHCATHIDAPRHFFPCDKSIDQISLDCLVGPALLIDLSPASPGAVIEWAKVENAIQNRSVERLVLRTDWSVYWNTGQYYKDWPCLSPECAANIVKRGIRMLAMDFPSPDPAYRGDVDEQDCPNHKLFFNNDTILVEYLTHLSELPAGWIFFMALPLKLKGFDGAPARVAAYSLEEKNG